MQSSSCLSIGAPTSSDAPDAGFADQWSTLGRLPVLSGSVIAEQQLRMSARRPKTLSEVRLAASNRFEHNYGRQAETGGLPTMLGSIEGNLTDCHQVDLHFDCPQPAMTEPQETWKNLESALNLPPPDTYTRAARDARYAVDRSENEVAPEEIFNTGGQRQLMLTSIANSLPAPRPPLDPTVLRQLVQQTQNRRMERIASRLDFANSRRKRALRHFHPSIQEWIDRIISWHNDLRFQSQIFATYVAQLRAR